MHAFALSRLRVSSLFVYVLSTIDVFLTDVLFDVGDEGQQFDVILGVDSDPIQGVVFDELRVSDFIAIRLLLDGLHFSLELRIIDLSPVQNITLNDVPGLITFTDLRILIVKTCEVFLPPTVQS